MSEEAKNGEVIRDGLLDVAEMAAWLRIKPDCLRDLVHAGKVPCIILNPRLWRFDRQTVQQALQKLTVN
jgi:excisionase family DNA binding protein